MGGLIKYMSSAVFITLFAIAILSFAGNFGDDNDAAIKLSEDGEFTDIKNQLTSDSTQISEDSNTSMDALITATLAQGDQATSTGGQFKVGIGTAVSMASTAISASFIKIFGKNTEFAIFFTVFSSMLVWIAGMLAYKAWIGRNPE